MEIALLEKELLISINHYYRKKLPKIIKFNKKLLNDVDVIFTALPNGEAQDISKNLNNHNTLIDLAADFRLEKASEYLKWYKQKHRATHLINKSLYSLPEINGKNLNKVSNYILSRLLPNINTITLNTSF